MAYDRLIINHKISRLQILLTAKQHNFDDDPRITELKKRFDETMKSNWKTFFDSKGLTLSEENENYLNQFVEEKFGAKPEIKQDD